MKKLLELVITCIVLVVIIDICFGALCDWYLKDSSISTREYERIDYVMKHSTDDIVILGSSLALRCLMPSIMEDSLGMTCFNGGASAQGMPYCVSMMECVLERHKPRMFVLAMRPHELNASEIGDPYKKLTPYYGTGYNMIDSYLEMSVGYKKYFLKSNLYRYNRIWMPILRGLLINTLYKHSETGWCKRLCNLAVSSSSSFVDDKNGFEGRDIPLVFPSLYDEDGEGEVVDDRKAEFVSMAEKCHSNGVQFVVYFPPQYIKFKKKTETIRFVENYCKEHDIPCFNDLQNEEFLRHEEWFYDNIHLNKNGAAIYTKHFITELKEYNSKTRRR